MSLRGRHLRAFRHRGRGSRHVGAIAREGDGHRDERAGGRLHVGRSSARRSAQATATHHRPQTSVSAAHVAERMLSAAPTRAARAPRHPDAEGGRREGRRSARIRWRSAARCDDISFDDIHASQPGPARRGGRRWIQLMADLDVERLIITTNVSGSRSARSTTCSGLREARTGLAPIGSLQSLRHRIAVSSDRVPGAQPGRVASLAASTRSPRDAPRRRWQGRGHQGHQQVTWRACR